MDVKRTHTLAKQPRLSVGRLADYMAASEQGKRAIAQSCKYRPIARVVQHDEAKSIISNYLLKGKEDSDWLHLRADQVRGKLADSDFEVEVNQHNADYLDRFAEVVAEIALPKAELKVPPRFEPLAVEGVHVIFQPIATLARLTKTNKQKIGALMLRYAKGKPLAEKIANYQSALIFGYLRENAEIGGIEAERQLCLTLDAYKGVAHVAPGNSVYLFNEVRAACATIAERWPNIPPPKNAVL